MEESQELQDKKSEIDLVDIGSTLWKTRRSILKFIIVFFGLGLFLAVFSENEYTGSTIIVPQSNNSKNINGNLGGLAAMAGINLGNIGGDSGIPPALYFQIINSIPFQKELLMTPLTIKGQKEKLTFSMYYTEVYNPSLISNIKKYTIGLPGLISKTLRGKSISDLDILDTDGLLSITEDEEKLLKILSKKIFLETNDKAGFVRVSAIMPEAIAAAELTKSVQNLLQKYIVSFKVQKSKEQLHFIEKQYKEKEINFKEVQIKLAQFRDRNQHVNSALAKTNLKQLESQYELAFGIYVELAKQFETQKLQVKQDTPVFTILNPVSIPNERTSPKKVQTILIWIVFGVVFAIAKTLFVNFLKIVRYKR